MENKLVVSPSPHVHSGDTISKNMYGVVIALLPALLVALYYFGLGALMVTVTSVAACLFFEFAIQKYLLKGAPSLWDGSAALTGLLLAFNVPSNLPLWIVVIGALVAIGMGKMSFGGIGNNIFNPALVGRVFLLISFPVQMTTWPIVEAADRFTNVDVATGATPLAILKGVSEGNLDEMAMFLGNIGGSIGEVSALALLLGFAYMLWKRIITWHIPLSVFAGAAVLALIVGANPIDHLLAGGMMLGAIFMATDYVTSPMAKRGMLIYGFAIGALTVIIRKYGAYPEGMSFAILIMNATTPLINTYCKPKRFGEVRKNG
ncbi:MAG: RnfABCDGE type electron transport complex subunit D [Bacteroidales bacterium]